MKAFQTIQVQDPQLDKVQKAAKDSFQALASCPLIDGILVQDVPLLAGQDNVVQHRLSRPFLGIITVKSIDAATISSDQTNNKEPSKYALIQVHINTTASFWIF